MSRTPKWWYVAEYKCGCSADSHRRRELLNYCGTHGMDRTRITRLPWSKRTVKSDPL